MTTTTHSPARILAAYLVAQSLVTAYNSGAAWACFVGFMPDDDAVSDSAVAVTDTTGLQDGRQISDGEPIEFAGVQVRIRSLDSDAAWAKAAAIAAALNALTSGSVTLGGSTYSLRSVSQQSPVLSLGRERGTRRRTNLSINYLVTLDEA